MNITTVRTRFAPSPTGMMHIGNLRTALYEYLVAKSMNGSFILRIEDTDQARQVEGAEQVIYDTLRQIGLQHDEGPDVGGPYAPYIQSQRRRLYRPFAERLVAEGKAYPCFCTRERLEKLKEESPDAFSGYDRHCRNLSVEEVEQRLADGEPHAIRQKMPLTGTTVFDDAVFGTISVENRELEDQVLLKTDGYPTYNFANVIDDHGMNITHVVRGSEYLSSTPKYNRLYEDFGWDVPVYIHLPLIMGRNDDGSVAKLSKRHGATSFNDLVSEGYLPEAIVNYIALLGWAPGDTRELFTLPELVDAFKIDGIAKSPAVFDYDKLAWFNSQYLKSMSTDEFLRIADPWLNAGLGDRTVNRQLLAPLLQPRVEKLSDLPAMVSFLRALPDYDVDMHTHKKMKTNPEIAKETLSAVLPILESLPDWEADTLHHTLLNLASERGVKNGQILWPVRVAASGTPVTPGGAIEILVLLGRDESVRRLRKGLDKLIREEQ